MGQESTNYIFISARNTYLGELTKNWFKEHNLKYDHIELVGSHDKVESSEKMLWIFSWRINMIMPSIIHEECGIPVCSSTLHITGIQFLKE